MHPICKSVAKITLFVLILEHLTGAALTAFKAQVDIGRVSLARENETGGSWGQEVHILHVNV